MTAVVGLVGRLRNLSLEMSRQALADWAQMGSIATEVVDAKVANVPKRAQLLAAIQGPVALVTTRVEGRCEGPCFFVFPMALAAQAVGRFVMLPESEIQAKAAAGLDASGLEVFRELANLLCGSSNNVLARTTQGLRLSQSVDALRVATGVPDLGSCLDALPDGEFAGVAVTVRAEGATFVLHQLLPLGLARSMLS
ncbi:MAG: hypothetical protein KF830_01520 [Planctomycetes bacterium]|nr:hypothetical protein [Planctomycetota bacterium]